MTATVDKADVLAALTPDAVAAAYGLTGRWFGRWMRGNRCPEVQHGTAAFGLSREGKWHCWACDTGGDLLKLVAAAEQLDVRNDFGAVLEIAATIAGVEPEPDFGAPATLRKPTKRAPPVEALPPLAERLHVARARAEWVWSHLKQSPKANELGRHWFLVERGLSWAALPDAARVNVRDLGFWTMPGSYDEARGLFGESVTSSLRRTYNVMGVAVCVRHIDTGNITDVRARNAEPVDGEPKIRGMLGGLTVDARPGGTDLVACYGNPHALSAARVIVVEGWADYLTACLRWPKADVLGAVDAGQYPLVAAFAARYIAERGSGRVVLVAQDDRRTEVDEDTWEPRLIDGAAERAVNIATKRAIGLVGPGAVGFVEAKRYGVHDLNDLAKAGRLSELPEAP